MIDNRWIADALELDGKSKSGLAAAMGVHNSAVTSLVQNKRGVKMHELPRIVDYLGVQPPKRIRLEEPPRFVRLAGYVGAGAAMVLFAEGDDPNEEVNAPEGTTDDTVAVEIRGESLGALFDRWLVFYDQVRVPPEPGVLGRLCVVGLADGRVLVKQLKKGQLGHPHYNLLSNTEPPIYDVIVEWAAVVKQMTPR